jgi:antitoxin component HigA of HigAB toxin-antitoxin module
MLLNYNDEKTMNTASIHRSIESESDYISAMQQMEVFAQKTRQGGFNALSEAEQETFGILAETIEEYEHQHFPFPTREEMIEQHSATH